MSGYDDRLKDYVDVKERIRLFYERYPEGALTTAEVRLTDNPDRVWVHAQAYRSPADEHPGDGWSWMNLPGTTPYTRGSEIENTETSAWGRAIGALGIGIEKSIASRDEVDAKAGEPEVTTSGGETAELLGRIQKAGQLIPGTAAAYKGEWRETPDGWAIGFKFKLAGEDRDIPQVLISGPIGSAIHALGEDLAKAKVTVKGHLYNVKPARGGSYYRLVVGDHPDYDFVETTEWRMPASHTEPSADVEVQPEAPSTPMFDDADAAAVDAAMSGAGR